MFVRRRGIDADCTGVGGGRDDMIDDVESIVVEGSSAEDDEEENDPFNTSFIDNSVDSLRGGTINENDIFKCRYYI